MAFPPSHYPPASSTDAIELSDHEPFAVGGTRRCYIHPCDKSLCIKVLREDRTPEKRRELIRGIKRFRSLKHWDDQWKEFIAYRRLSKNITPSLWSHVPEFLGLIQTNYGIGVVTKLFRNFDGSFPLNLEQQVPLGIDAALQAGIEDFKAWLRQELVITRDLLPHNIIAVRDDANSYRLVIVDGIGNSEWIPFSSWTKSFARRKIERKIRKFEFRLQELQPAI